MRQNGTFFALTLGLLLGACAAPPVPAAPPVDAAQSVIFYNGPILTMDPAQPMAEALAVRGDKVEAVGSATEVMALQTADTQLVDLGGLTLMPGFVDAHTHILNDARAAGQSLDEAQYQALRNGITTLGDLYVDEAFLREITAFDAQGALRVRTSLYLAASDPCGRVLGDWYERYPVDHTAGKRLRVEGVKLFTDGGSCGKVALSFELEPGWGEGDLWFTQDQLNQMVAEAQAGGYQVAIHAIGDRAVEQAQTALAAALAGGPNSYRHRMEHLSVLRPEQIGRFGELGVIPVLSGEYPACRPFGPPIPEPYHAWEWPWRELRDQNPGLPVAWHSDYPFASGNPFVHLYGFVTRRDVQSYYTCPAGEWLRDDTLSVAEALAVMTIESAYALFRETEVGSLEAGKYADVIVVSGDPRTVPADGLRSLRVLATMAGGRWEWCNPRNLAQCPGYQARTPVPLPDPRPPLAIRWLALGLAVLAPLGSGVGLSCPRLRRGLAALGGAAALAGGGLWAAAWLSEANGGMSDPTWPALGAGVLWTLGVAGLAAGLPRSRLGGVGLALAGVGAVALALGATLSGWFEQDGAWMVWILGLLGHCLGLVLAGIGSWRDGRGGRWGAGLLLAGGLAGVLAFIGSSLDQSSTWPLIVLGLGLGGGWAGLGLLLLSRVRGPAPVK